MNCRQVQLLLLDYLKNQIPLSEREQIKEHLEKCSLCQKELRFYQEYRSSIDCLERLKAPSDFEKKVAEKVALSKKISLFSLLKRLLHSIFTPLQIKLPLELAGLTMLIVIAFFIVTPFRAKKTHNMDQKSPAMTRENQIQTESGRLNTEVNKQKSGPGQTELVLSEANARKNTRQSIRKVKKDEAAAPVKKRKGGPLVMTLVMFTRELKPSETGFDDPNDPALKKSSQIKSRRTHSVEKPLDQAGTVQEIEEIKLHKKELAPAEKPVQTVRLDEIEEPGTVQPENQPLFDKTLQQIEKKVIKRNGKKITREKRAILLELPQFQLTDFITDLKKIGLLLYENIEADLNYKIEQSRSEKYDNNQTGHYHSQAEQPDQLIQIRIKLILTTDE